MVSVPGKRKTDRERRLVMIGTGLSHYILVQIKKIGTSRNRDLRAAGLSRTGLAEQLRAQEERHARYAPVLRFNFLDPAQRRFGVERKCRTYSLMVGTEL